MHLKKQLTLRSLGLSLGLKDGIESELWFAFTNWIMHEKTVDPKKLRVERWSRFWVTTIAFTNWIMFERTLRHYCLVVCLWLCCPQMSGQTLDWTREYNAVQTRNRGQHWFGTWEPHVTWGLSSIKSLITILDNRHSSTKLKFHGWRNNNSMAQTHA